MARGVASSVEEEGGGEPIHNQSLACTDFSAHSFLVPILFSFTFSKLWFKPWFYLSAMCPVEAWNIAKRRPETSLFIPEVCTQRICSDDNFIVVIFCFDPLRNCKLFVLLDLEILRGYRILLFESLSPFLTVCQETLSDWKVVIFCFDPLRNCKLFVLLDLMILRGYSIILF